MSREVSLQNDQYFRTLIEHSSDAFMLLTPKGFITYANPTSERITGYPSAALRCMDCFAFTHAGDRECMRQQFATLLDQPDHSITLEQRFQHKNGTWRWMEATMTNLLYEPTIRAIVATFHDITERKQVEEERHRLLVREQVARAEAEARATELFATVEAITDGIIIYDARGVIRSTNAVFRSFLALEDIDTSRFQLDCCFKKLNMRDMTGKPLSRDQLELAQDVYGTGTTMNVQCHTAKADTTILSISNAPIRNAAGQVTGGVMVLRDITEWRSLEHQLRYSERKLRALVDSNVLGVAVSDKYGRVLETNDRFAQMLGYSKEELLSGAVTKHQMIPDDYREAMAEIDEIFIKTGVMPPWEKVCLRKDGTRLPTLMAGAMIDPERGLAIVLFHDISDRKEIEKRKQEFLCMVSHELRTPLTSIAGMVELALMKLEQLPDSLPPKVEETKNQIEKMLKCASGQADIEARLVEELLEASRLETHQFELSVQPENLVTIVQEAAASQQRAIQTHPMKLDLPAHEVVPVTVDAGRITQVLTNYLTNAVKYTPTNSAISIRLEVTENTARVAVSDQGPGLTQEQQRQVWKHFYQAETPRSRKPNSGLGLGLAIAKAIIEQHHGRVGVESIYGQGSTFWFSLPLDYKQLAL